MKLPSISGDIWINSKPLSSDDLKGKVVLIDFWTYSCINCRRTLPYLKKWWQKYKDKNFLLIGIHSPEFDFEKDSYNVGKAVEELGVNWPVVLDNDYKNWTNFSNHYWPAKYLADQNGNIVYEHFGEGAYEHTEEVIQDLLKNQGEILMPEIESEHQHGKVCFRPTPETYCGFQRGHLDNPGGYHYFEEYNYKAPEKLSVDSIALSGKFSVREQYVESAEKGARLLLNFRATEVNLVMGPAEKEAAVGIFLNGAPLRREIYGKDVKNNEVLVGESAMYNLVKSRDPLGGILSISAKRGNFRAYAFTFSGCNI